VHLLMYISNGKLTRRFVVNSLLAFDSVLVNQKKTGTEQSVLSADIEQHDHDLSQNNCTELFKSAAFVPQNKCTSCLARRPLCHKINVPSCLVN